MSFFVYNMRQSSWIGNQVGKTLNICLQSLHLQSELYVHVSYIIIQWFTILYAAIITRMVDIGGIILYCLMRMLIEIILYG